MPDTETYAALAELPTLHNDQWWPGTRDLPKLLPCANWPARFAALKGKPVLSRPAAGFIGLFEGDEK